MKKNITVFLFAVSILIVLAYFIKSEIKPGVDSSLKKTINLNDTQNENFIYHPALLKI